MELRKIEELIEHYTKLKEDSLKSMKRLIGKPQQDYHTASFSNFTLFIKDLEKLRDNLHQKEKLDIQLKSWDYTCADGCCTDFGTQLFLNGEVLEHPDKTITDNGYVGECVETALKAVLNKLGYEVEIEY